MRLLAAFCLFFALLAPGQAQEQKSCDISRDANGCSFLTVHGRPLVFESARWDADTKARVTYSGRTIYEPEEGYVSWTVRARVGNEVVVVAERGEGGSGTINQFTLIAVPLAGAPKVIVLPETARGRVAVSRDGAALRIDLGYVERKRVMAVYRNGAVTTPTGPEDDRLPESDCTWLQRQVLRECAGDGHRGDDDCQFAPDALSGGSSRGEWALGQYPAFEKERFRAVCQAACRANKTPTLASVRANLCRRAAV